MGLNPAAQSLTDKHNQFFGTRVDLQGKVLWRESADFFNIKVQGVGYVTVKTEFMKKSERIKFIKQCFKKCDYLNIKGTLQNVAEATQVHADMISEANR